MENSISAEEAVVEASRKLSLDDLTNKSGMMFPTQRSVTLFPP